MTSVSKLLLGAYINITPQTCLYAADFPKLVDDSRFPAVRVAWQEKEATFQAFQIKWNQSTFLPSRARVIWSREKETSNLPDVTYSQAITVTINGQKLRCVRDGESILMSKLQKSNEISTFDGNEWRKLSNKNASRKFPQGILEASCPDYRDIVLRPLFLAVRPSDPRLSGISLNDLMVEGTATLRNSECMILRAPAESRLQAVKLFLDPDRSWSIVRYQVIAQEEAMVLRQIDIDYSQRPDSSWAPHSWTYSENIGQGEAILTSATVESLKIPTDISEETFRLDFPEGTVVFDQRTSTTKRFLVTANNEQRPITAAELRGGATYEQIASTPSGKALSSSMRSRRVSWIFWLNVVVLLLCAGLIGWRWYRKTAV